MFEVLGYEYDKEESIKGHLELFRNHLSDSTILFNMITKEYGVFHFNNDYYRFIPTGVHKAITQQMKELGWL